MKAQEIARLALEKKAENVVIINVRKLTSVSDYIVVCSGESERQVQAIASNIEDSLRTQGERPIGIEGVASGRWALVDYGDVVVHVFLHDIRKFYDIEGLWADAPAVTVRDKSEIKKAAAKSAEKKAAPAVPKAIAVKTVAEEKTARKPAVKKPGSSASKATAVKKPVLKIVEKKTPAGKKAAAKKPAAKTVEKKAPAGKKPAAKKPAAKTVEKKAPAGKKVAAKTSSKSAALKPGSKKSKGE